MIVRLVEMGNGFRRSELFCPQLDISERGSPAFGHVSLLVKTPVKPGQDSTCVALDHLTVHLE